MNNHHVFAFLALGALGLAGCGTDYSGAYKGEATETGTVTIAVPQTTNVAKNESPPRKIADQTVTVTKQGEGYSAKFNACELSGKMSGPTMLVATGECDVKIANWEGKLPLSATLTFKDGGEVSMDVTTTKKNETTVVTYSYTFKGKK